MLRCLSQLAGFGLSLVAMIGTAHADMPIPSCMPCSDNDQTCFDWYGTGWIYCGDAGGDWIYCCYAE